MSTRSAWIVVGCLCAFVIVCPRVSTVGDTKPPGTSSYPIRLRPADLARGGATLIAPAHATGCARYNPPFPAAGGVVLGIATCDAASAPGGWLQVERTFDAPYASTVLTLRIAPPEGKVHFIRSLQRDARARVLLDGRPIWQTRATSDDGRGAYLTLIEPDILTTFVVKKPSPHRLRFEAEPGLIWNIGTIEITAHPLPRHLRGIAYSPLRDCQAPGGARQPSASDVDDDMFQIAHSSDAIRTYSATGINATVVSTGDALGHPVYAGAWLDEIASDESELRALMNLAQTSRAAGFIVGNEFYLRHRAEGRRALDYLLERIRRFKVALPSRHAPVMTAEVDGVMFEWTCEGGANRVKGITREYEPILDETDAILVHIYPFWEGRSIDGAAALAAARYVAIRDFVGKRYPGKRVILGETGWPSAGARVGAAVPGRDAQRRYLAELLQLADAMDIDLFYFDAFDEGWKLEEPGHVGQHWGYADSTRAAKYDISGTLIPAALLAGRTAIPLGTDGKPVGSTTPSICGGTPAPTSGTAGSAGTPGDRTCDGGTIYSEWLSDDSRFVPAGWIGDTRKVDLFECDRSDPHGGEMAIRAEFSPDGPRGWAGVVWHDAKSDWGKRPGGCDLRRFDRLRFWVKGARGGEVVEFKVGGMGTEQDRYRDTIRPARSTGPLILTATWQPVTIDLTGADRSRVIGGFTWVASRCQNREPITFFVDDIRFDTTADRAITPPLERKPFYVYDDDGSDCGHYAPSGFMGDIADLTLNTRNSEAPFKGRAAIQVVYRPDRRSAKRWAGIYWQDPPGNWGTRDGGFDLSWSTVLTFHARGRRGGEAVELFAGGLGSAKDAYRDSLFPKRTTDVVHLTRDWQRYTIDLRGRDLSRVAGGFGLALSAANNPQGAEIFLDEIAYERQ
jgi:exo-beta-1,3-glucanase (GH17 family)